MANSWEEVGRIIRVRLYSYCRDQLAINVLHYRVATAAHLTTTTDVQIANGLNTLFRDIMADGMPHDASYIGCDHQAIDPFITASQHTTTALREGQIDDLPLPLQTTGVITKKTALGGRAYRGRFYMPFPSNAHMDTDQRPHPSYVAILNVIGAKIVDTGVVTVNSTDTFRGLGVIWHPPQEDPPVPSSYTFIEAAFGKRAWGVQRRRGDYGRQNPLPW